MTQDNTPVERAVTQPAEAPPSLYVVALYQLLGGALALYLFLKNFGPHLPAYQRTLLADIHFGLPYPLVLASGLFNNVAAIIIGVGIFLRWEWVRPLFIAVFMETTVLTLFTLKAKGPIGFLTLLVTFCVSLYIAHLLYRAPATHYFSRRGR